MNYIKLTSLQHIFMRVDVGGRVSVCVYMRERGEIILPCEKKKKRKTNF